MPIAGSCSSVGSIANVIVGRSDGASRRNVRVVMGLGWRPAA